jgi:transposase-like protein
VSRAEIAVRRRKWSRAEKAALLAEIDAEGGKVPAVARRHGLSESLLYNWRSARNTALTATQGSEALEFIPVGRIIRGDDALAMLTPPMMPSPETPVSVAVPSHSKTVSRPGTIEIELPSGAKTFIAAVSPTDSRVQALHRPALHISDRKDIAAVATPLPPAKLPDPQIGD